MATRLIRVFVSSTFNDFVVERNALQAEVFPRIADFCRQHGARFQAVDLRWGVSEEAGRDQQTLDVCLQEIQRCQKTTPRPNFIALLGARYGWRPLPPRIPIDEFQALFAHLSRRQQAVLERWYRRDDNAVPPQWILQPVGDSAAWDLAERELRTVLRDGVAAQVWPEDDPRRLKYEASATHQELIHGFLDPPNGIFDPRQHVCCYFRTVDLPERIEAGSPVVCFADYVVDRNSGDLVRDRGAARRLNLLEDRIRRLLPSDQVHEYHANWTSEGIVLDVPDFCQRVETNLRRQIELELQRLQQVKSQVGGEEARIHLDFGTERSRCFIGREDSLARITAYLADVAVQEPLVITGPSGVGKSSLLARAAHCTGLDSTVLQRYLGVTPAASTLRSVLSDLLGEIDDYDGGQSVPPTDLQELATEWLRRLGQAAANRPIVLFLDALDQLSATDNSNTLFWFPRQLPPGVKLVASVLEADGDAGVPARAIAALLPPSQQLRLHPLPENEASQLMQYLLQQIGRTLQPEQWKEMALKFGACSSPLYVRILFHDARRWTSYDKVPRDLAADTTSLLRQLFIRLEDRRHHSPVLVRRSLGYLAAARHGLTEDELLDALSSDGTIMHDFREHSPTERSKPATDQLSRMPPILWSRLRFDLADYLTEREADGTAVLSFFHREIDEVVRSRYLQPPARHDLHGSLAQQFGRQPLVQSGEAARARQFNLRKLAELPYQLVEGELWPELADLLAGNFAFLKAKAEAGQAFDLVEDYARGQAGLSDMPQLAAPLSFVRRHASVLGLQPELFFQQAYNHGAKTPLVRAAQQWLGTLEEPSRWIEWLNRPKESSLPICLQEFAGHTGWVTSVALSGDGRTALSGSDDHTVRVWEMSTGRCCGILRGHTKSVRSIAVSADARTAVSGAWDNTVRVWDLPSGQCRIILTGHSGGVNSVALSDDGRTVVSAADDKTVRMWDLSRDECRTAFVGHSGWVRGVALSADGRRIVSGAWDNTIRVWDTSSGQCDAILTGHTGSVTCVALSPDGGTAVSGSKDSTLRVWDLSSGRCCTTLTGHTKFVKSVALSKDLRTVVSGADDHTLRAWDLPTGRCRTTLFGHTDCVNGVVLLPDGQAAVSGADDQTVRVWDISRASGHANHTGHTRRINSVTLSADGRTAVSGADDTTVRMWDLLSGECRATFAGHVSKVSSVALSADGRTVVSGSWDKTVRAWDVTSAQCRHILRGHTQEVNSVALSGDGRTAVSGGRNNYTVRVWDLISGRCSAELAGHTGGVDSVVLSTDGRTAISGSGDNVVRVWDLSSGQCRATLVGHTSGVTGVTLSADGRTVVSESGWSSDNTVRVWELTNGRCTAIHKRGSPEAHGAWVRASSGARLVYEKTIRSLALWSGTGEVLARFPGHFSASAFSGDGQCGIAGDASGQIYFLRIRTRGNG